MSNIGRFIGVKVGLLAPLVAAVLLVAMSSLAADTHTSKPFTGIKVNGGTVTHTSEGNKSILTLSDDFKVPDTPDPHWQVVDSKGTFTSFSVWI